MVKIPLEADFQIKRQSYFPTLNISLTLSPNSNSDFSIFSFHLYSSLHLSTPSSLRVTRPSLLLAINLTAHFLRLC